MSTATYPRQIQHRLDEIELDRQRVLSHLDEALIVEACIAETGLGWWAAQPHGITYYLDFDGRESLEHFLAPVFRFLRARGYKFQRRDDTPETGGGTVHIYFNKPDGTFSGIHLYVGVPMEEGVSCRFVEVGKKEVPVYELKCETVPS